MVTQVHQVSCPLMRLLSLGPGGAGCLTLSRQHEYKSSHQDRLTRGCSPSGHKAACSGGRATRLLARWRTPGWAGWEHSREPRPCDRSPARPRLRRTASRPLTTACQRQPDHHRRRPHDFPARLHCWLRADPPAGLPRSRHGVRVMLPVVGRRGRRTRGRAALRPRRADGQHCLLQRPALGGADRPRRLGPADHGSRRPVPDGEVLSVRPGRLAEYEADFITSREWLPETALAPAVPFPAVATGFGTFSSAHVAPLPGAPVGDSEHDYLDQHRTQRGRPSRARRRQWSSATQARRPPRLSRGGPLPRTDVPGSSAAGHSGTDDPQVLHGYQSGPLPLRLQAEFGSPIMAGLSPARRRKPRNSREFPSRAIMVRGWPAYRIGPLTGPGPP